MGKGKALIAMSGGVDSSVAAMLTVEAGYDCAGVTMQLFKSSDNVFAGASGSNRPKPPPSEDARCPAPPHSEDARCPAPPHCKDVRCPAPHSSDADHPAAPSEDARAVASKLGIPFFVYDFSNEFSKHVVERFVNAYLGGITPNPCIYCNQNIKFDRFLQLAIDNGYNYTATGHYARIERCGERYLLRKGLDAAKDQSYVLYMLTQEQLRHTIFPLGELTKNEVRAIARAQGLANADKRESQDICFVPDGDYAKFIETYVEAAKAATAAAAAKLSAAATSATAAGAATAAPATVATTSGGGCSAIPKNGAIVDMDGNILGEHRGIYHYTIGQKKGLGSLASPNVSRPLYVCELHPETNTVVVGPAEMLCAKTLTARNINFIAIDKLDAPLRASVKIRYNQAEQPAIVEQIGADVLRIDFDSPQRAITKGQAIVLYEGDLVIGGGTIL